MHCSLLTGKIPQVPCPDTMTTIDWSMRLHIYMCQQAETSNNPAKAHACACAASYHFLPATAASKIWHFRHAMAGCCSCPCMVWCRCHPFNHHAPSTCIWPHRRREEAELRPFCQCSKLIVVSQPVVPAGPFIVKYSNQQRPALLTSVPLCHEHHR